MWALGACQAVPAKPPGAAHGALDASSESFLSARAVAAVAAGSNSEALLHDMHMGLGFGDDSGPMADLFSAEGVTTPMQPDELPPYVNTAKFPAPMGRLNTYEGAPMTPPEMCNDPSQPQVWLDRRGPCNMLTHREVSDPRPVLPSLFIPGFPKSATTWLFECMDSAFTPEVVCPIKVGANASAADAWNPKACLGRRFYLPAIQCDEFGRCKPHKELFFYNRAGRLHPLDNDMPSLFGPKIPLDYFGAHFSAARPDGLTDEAWAAQRGAQMQSFCTEEQYTMLRTPPGSPTPRMHPACSGHRSAKRPGEVLESPARVLPWAKEGEYDFLTGDFTPNYLCSSRALHNIAAVAGGGKLDGLRFIVIGREPIKRAYSEWSMFHVQWQWDSSADFHGRMMGQVEKLRQCNTTLFNNTALLEKLPDTELFNYLDKCFPSQAMEYVGNSLYSVCVLAAQRLFKPEQFLFLRYEDIVRMQTPAMLSMLSKFTGLYTDEGIIDSVSKRGTCNAAKSQHPMKASTDQQSAESMLTTTEKELTPLFTQYDALMEKLAGSGFNWS